MPESMFLLIHHREKIDENTSEGVTFSSKKQIGVFNSILQKLEKCGKKCIKQVFFRIPISLRQCYVKFGKYEMLGNDDMRSSKISRFGRYGVVCDNVDLWGSAPNPPIGVIEGSSNAIPANLSVQADNIDDLGDVRTFGELATAMRAAPVLDGALEFIEARDKNLLTEAIGDDGLDSKLPIIGDDRDGEEDTTRASIAQAQSSS
ncbi:hypothetical protein Ahy_B07g086445 [Arachis hypogaea]|uniref:Uncharacterized protein n=1 Tax=Arachis hypogaea TaxID=3818 RepID=A0A444YA19_ARAHY|nr:hypothetical protein Ahy_B07g086445 [Arachis hypogaea]